MVSKPDAPARFTRHCKICGQTKSGMVPGALIRPAILAEIQKSRPDFNFNDDICVNDLNRFRFQHVQSLMASERGELTALDNDVLQSLHQHELLTSNIEADFASKLTFGENLADKIADFGGSWKFIIIFAGILSAWIAINSLVFLFKPFDPFPYILLNLVLSCLAALQAPVIMMSQNRQEAKDRLRSENDYRVNLKAELEIRHLHEKIDHLLSRQWERLVDIQQVQLDLMSEIVTIRSKKGS
ncbi:MAG: DUF1003 domain-containing protein [Desulfobacteraceae bacterium]|nr:DUF1003 domain-containing protein [Desulfobacteraceae bacterium]